MEIYGADLKGIDGYLIHLTATAEPRGMGMRLLGRAQRVVKEGSVRAAGAIGTLKGEWSDVLQNQGYTIQFKPAETPKTSSGLDLPIALMLLQASILEDLETIEKRIAALREQYEAPAGKGSKAKGKSALLAAIKQAVEKRKQRLKYRRRFRRKTRYLLIGELNMASGNLTMPEHGMFGMMDAAKRGFVVIIPEEAEVHGALVAQGRKDITIVKASDLQEAWDVVLGVAEPRPVAYRPEQVRQKRVSKYTPDLRDIRGVARAKRAMTVALAGGHNILLVGPTGEGKTMLALAALSLLPKPTLEEVYEINKVYSARGELEADEIILERPFQEEGDKVTEAGLFGGNTPPVPGIISLAHRGILVLDEVNLFKGNLIERLRRTLVNRVVRIHHSQRTIEYPCSIVLVATMNPCKCGWHLHYECPVCGSISVTNQKQCPRHPDRQLRHMCKCKGRGVTAYRDKLSRPLLERIDLRVLVSPHDVQESEPYRYASTTVRKRIESAREVQARRYGSVDFVSTNAELRDRSQFAKCAHGMPPSLQRRLPAYFKGLGLSSRMKDRVRFVARTIADLDGRSEMRASDVREAVELMGLDHPYFRHFGR
ncbi:ATP-binding protein [Planctomycetota bacterium]